MKLSTNTRWTNPCQRFLVPLVALFSLMFVAFAAHGQSDAVYAWTNFVGQPGGRGNLDGTGSGARFNSPTSVAVDTNGNVLVADKDNHTIRKVTSAGVVTTLAGSAGTSGTNDGTGSAARFNWLSGVAVDKAGNLFVADRSSFTIRKVTTAGVVTTLAGSAGISGTNDGFGSAARFTSPTGVAVDSTGNIFVADRGNHTIRQVTAAGEVTTLAGSAGSPGDADGTGSAARFRLPSGVAVDSVGNVFVADEYNHTIRKVTVAGVVTTLAGSGGAPGTNDGPGTAARFNYPSGVAVDTNGNVFVADESNHTIRQVTPAGEVTTLAGNASITNIYGPLGGYADGTGSAARFWYPSGVSLDSAGNVFVADSANNSIRKVTPAGEVTTLAGNPGYPGSADGTGSAARLWHPPGLAVDKSGSVFMVDNGNCTIRKVTSAGEVTTFAGSAGQPGNADGTGSSARFNYPDDVAADSNGNLFVADTFSHTIRRVTAARVVATFAGFAGFSGTNDGTGTAARFNYPRGVAVDSAGNVFVADQDSHTIRKVTVARVVTTFAGSAGISGSNDGTGSAARFNYPNGVAVDRAGNVFVADGGNYAIRMVTSNGVVTTLAGSAGNPGSADGPGSAARFYGPSGVAVDSVGNVFVTDYGNSTIRKVTAAGVVTTIGGIPGVLGAADGLGSSAIFANPGGIAVDSAGTLYVADYNNNRISKGTPIVLRFDSSPAGLHWTPNGLQLTVTGLLGWGPVTIYVSTNLANWEVLLTNPPVTGPFQVLDTGATNAARRFYRVSEER